MRLYHGTDSKNLASILKDGLRPNRIGIVYLSPQPTRRWGDSVVEVETGDLKLTAFDGCEDWEVLCWGRVPPEDIKQEGR